MTTVNGSVRPAEDATRLLQLVQLCDSALPIGAYSHSWGLEAAVHRRQVRGPVELEAWVRAWLSEVVVPGDGLAVAHAVLRARYDAWEELDDLNDLLTASKPAPTLRHAEPQPG